MRTQQEVRLALWSLPEQTVAVARQVLLAGSVVPVQRVRHWRYPPKDRFEREAVFGRVGPVVAAASAIWQVGQGSLAA